MDNPNGKKKDQIPVYIVKGHPLGIVQNFRNNSKNKTRRKRAPHTASKPEDSSMSGLLKPEKSLGTNSNTPGGFEAVATDPEQATPKKSSAIGDAVPVSSKGEAKDEEGPVLRESREDDILQAERKNKAETHEQPKVASMKSATPPSESKIADITLPGVSLGSNPDFQALRCDYSCPEHAQGDDSKLGGAHTLCMTHWRYHCTGVFNERCKDVVLCTVSVQTYKGMQVDWRGDVAETWWSGKRI